jgi:regulator of replication initiation timing
MKKEVVNQINDYVNQQVRELTYKINSNAKTINKLAFENTALKRTLSSVNRLLKEIQKSKVEKKVSKFIWDNGVNHSIVTIIDENSTHYLLKILVGSLKGTTSYAKKSSVIPYNLPNLKQCLVKYGKVKEI